MTQLGRNTPAGFLPAEPRAEQILEKLDLLKGGFESLRKNPATTHLVAAAENPRAELLRSYARFYHGTAHAADQKAILDDLLDQTLRRSHVQWQPGQSLEEYAAYGLSRGGQDGIVIYIMKMMQDGMELPAPGASKSRKKK